MTTNEPPPFPQPEDPQGASNPPPPPPPPPSQPQPPYPGGSPGYGTPPPGSPPPDAPGGYGAPRARNDKALWSMILGIVSIVCCGLVAGIPAIILGHIAKNEIDASQGMQEGRGMAQAGFVLGIIGSVLSVLGGIVYVIALATASTTGTAF